MEFPYTDENMQNDLQFYIAKRLTSKLLEEGMSTEDEYRRVMLENVRNFSPTLAPLLLENC